MKTDSSIFEELEKNGKIIYSSRGLSMYPLIHQDTDLLVIEKRPIDSLKKYDAILYRSGENLVLHRIIKVTDSGFITRGDNNTYNETVSREDVLGLLTGLIRNGKTISIDDLSYRLYKRIVPARRYFLKFKQLLKAFAIANFVRIFKILTRKEKKSIIIIGILALISSLIEIVCVNAIMPYMNVLLSAEKAMTTPVIRRIYASCSNTSFIIIVSLLLCMLYVFKGFFAIFNNYLCVKSLRNVRTHYSLNLYSYYLHRPYELFLNENIDVLQRRVVELTATVFSGIISGTLNVFEQLIIVLGIVVSLFSFGSSIVSATVICFLLLFFVLYNFSKNRLRVISIKTNEVIKQYRRTVSEHFKTIREIKYSDTINESVEIAEKCNNSVVSMILKRTLISSFTGQILEVGAVVTCISIIVGSTIGVKVVANNIAQLSLYGVAVLKLRQSLKGLLSNLNYVIDNTGAYDELMPDIIESIKWEKNKVNSVPAEILFNNNILLEDVCYKYPDTDSNVLTDINMNLKKGQIIGIEGVSGIGKSTLLYLITGMLTPSSGKVLVDGFPITGNEETWQKEIGYISQNIYLFDATIRENVALGLPEDSIDSEAVYKALRFAHLEDYVDSLPLKDKTVIGDNGIRLSGGQRQRLGIARALYSDIKILVCDEATNSLDSETEEDIMNSLLSLSDDLTIIVISHNPKPLTYCDEIYSLKNGRISIKNRA